MPGRSARMRSISSQNCRRDSGIDAGGRLIEDQQVRIVDQRAAKAQLLLHAAGKLAGRAVCKGCESGGLQQFCDAPRPLAVTVPEQTAEEIDILEHGERLIEVLPQSLGHVGDVRADCAAVLHAGHVPAQHLDRPALDHPCAGNERKEARFADAVRPDDANHPARRQIERDRVQCLHLAVAQTD